MVDMSATWVWILEVIGKVVIPILNLITPEIKDALNKFLTDLYLKALKTSNPWDDLFIGMLLDVLAIPRPPP